MQVAAGAQVFPVWQNGYSPEPVKQGSALESAVFAPVAQPDATNAGTTAPGSRASSKTRADSNRHGTDPSGEANGSAPANAAADQKVNRRGQGQDQGQNNQGDRQQGAPGQTRGPDGKPLSPAQQAEVRKLEARNRQVVAHEQAHEAAGGGLAGAISYAYQRGPNGKRYAVGGDVPIRINQDPNHPRATIAQMRQVISAALAPADPSSQDRSVASRATQILLRAQRELAAKATSSASPPTNPVNHARSRAVISAYTGVAGLGRSSVSSQARPVTSGNV